MTIDQNSAYPPAMIVAPAGRLAWPSALDARVRSEHRNINQDYGSMYRMTPLQAGIVRACRSPGAWTQQIGRILRSRDGYHQAMKGDRLYQVYRKGKKWITTYYSRDSFFLTTSKSKRRALAIAKGEKWLCE
jgi:hypothetical protein